MGRSETRSAPIAPASTAACAVTPSNGTPRGVAVAISATQARRTSAPASGFAESAGPARTTTGPERSRRGSGANGNTFTSTPGLSVTVVRPAITTALAAVSSCSRRMPYRCRKPPLSPPGLKPKCLNSPAMYAATFSSSGLGVLRPRIESSAMIAMRR